MNLEHKTTLFEVKETDETGMIGGYANVYGVEDLGGDIVVKGAFAEGLEGKTFPMLWGHDSFSMPIGVWTKAYEDDRGLYVEGKLSLGMTAADDALIGVKSGSISGLSIGFKTLDKEQKNEIRYIKKAELWETSLVTFPMNVESRIDAVKAAEMTERQIEQRLTRDAKFSRSVARLLMKGGYSALQAKQDAGDGEVKSMLESILTEIRAEKET